MNSCNHTHSEFNADSKLFKKLAYVHDLASQTPPLFEIDGRVPIARATQGPELSCCSPQTAKLLYIQRYLYAYCSYMYDSRKTVCSHNYVTAVTSFTTPRYLLQSFTVINRFFSVLTLFI